MFTRLPDRPWGRMWMVAQGASWWVKIINVRPNQRTSNQYHANRAEWHWRLSWRLWRKDLSWMKIVRPGRLHRMYQGVYIEIAWGKPNENDITRVSDDYGRTRG